MSHFLKYKRRDNGKPDGVGVGINVTRPYGAAAKLHVSEFLHNLQRAMLHQMHNDLPGIYILKCIGYVIKLIVVDRKNTYIYKIIHFQIAFL